MWKSYDCKVYSDLDLTWFVLFFLIHFLFLSSTTQNQILYENSTNFKKDLKKSISIMMFKYK